MQNKYREIDTKLLTILPLSSSCLQNSYSVLHSSFWSLSQKGVSRHTPEIAAISTPFSCGLWIIANSSLKHLTYALSVLFGRCLILAKRLSRVAYFLAPQNWCMNNPESCVQGVMVLGLICLNHFLVVAVSVMAEHLHLACDGTWNRSIQSLKASR